MPRTGTTGCRNRCRAPRCKGLSKRSSYADRCCLCTRDASQLCHWHRRYDGPETSTRKPDRAATVGNGVRVADSTIPNSGKGLFAVVPFASNDIITRYQPNPADHHGSDLLSRREASAIHDQRWICQKDGNYVAGLRSQVAGQGGGSFANDKPGHYNCEYFVHPSVLNHIYLKVLSGKVIKPGEEMFANYGGGRAVAMGDARL